MAHVPSIGTRGPAGPSHREFLRPPSTRPGRWALGLMAAAVALFALVNVIVASGQEGGETFFDNLYISIPMFGAGTTVIAAGCFAGFAVVRRRERSLLVLAVAVFGLLVLAFLVGELTTPH